MLSFIRPPFRVLPRVLPRALRSFSTTTHRPARAVVYTTTGAPTEVLRVLTYPTLPPPAPGSINVEFLLAPINPADLNVVEGVYPSKPRPGDEIIVPPRNGATTSTETAWVGGNEGLARVTAVGADVGDGLRAGDWVVLTRPQAGTWAAARTVGAGDVARVPDAQALSEAQAATLTVRKFVNPPTAYNILADYVDLKPGDWVVQNGANSAVGQAVIQIAKARGLQTLNFVRDRPDIASLKDKLQKLGATHVLTYDELADKSVREQIKSWTGGKQIRLGLNCVGGKDTTAMARLLGSDAHLVSYGAMAKQPLSLPTSLFIFKNLTCHGFWQTRWYAKHDAAARAALMRTLVGLIKDGKLDTPEHEIVTIPASESDEEATQRLREALEAMSEGKYGKKVLLKIEDKAY
ncbi:NAD(P)-binding protein [Pholiota conissans]|uniref:enoyl-[acyl-carrier-protein] reductase n=1 Tax=Pholiota conissans TaxID=109636 RepID=A0A9P5YP51_9AGAR|nr:NAD(P)-binding protein [Pholiota conissans]